MKEEIFRNTCPRNCYGTCGILSYVKDGRLIKVTGDPKHGYTKGKLCAKGYAYTQYLYSPKRLKYPMFQNPRGSGNWKRISWDEAYLIIAKKLIELQHRYGSNLASGYNKFSGNLGILHYAVEGMFNSIGPHSKPVGNCCDSTGIHAVKKSLGSIFSSNPENMSNSRLIVLWGGNPVVTNVHQMKYIYEARSQGAKFIVIDPIFTKTAEKADIYIQINPGTDEWLALGVTKLLIESGKYPDSNFQEYTIGWEKYRDYIKKHVNLYEVSKRTGISIETIELLAEYYGSIKPAATWIGLGIQRSIKGSRSICGIITLSEITGNLDIPFGGFYFVHKNKEHFPNNLLNHKGPDHTSIKASREIDANNYANNALKLSDPPLKFLWLASRNIITQDQDLNSWKQLFNQLELIVTVDLFLTKTAEQSDIVLPAASHFEEEDLHVGYWHYWLSINQKAIPPYYEAKSDLQIAREMTKKLNELSPSFSNFPYEKEPIDWIKQELTPEIMLWYSIKSYEDLLEGPHQRQEPANTQFPPAKFQLNLFDTFFFENDEELVKNSDKEKTLFYKLLTPQSLLKIHSQYEMVPWLNQDQTNDFIEISPETASYHKIDEATKIEIFNEEGLIVGKVKINPTLPSHVVLSSQAGKNPINKLINQTKQHINHESSSFYYDSMVRIRKWSEEHV